MAETLPLSRWSRDVLVIGIVGALLLHLAVGWGVVFGWPSLDLPQPAPTLVAVEFVDPPAPPPPPPEPEPPPAEAAPRPPLPMALPPPPVLEEAPVADVSRPTPAPGPESRRPGPAERPQGPAREAPAPPAPAPPPPPPAIVRGGAVVTMPPVRRITPPSLVDDAPFRIGRADRGAGAGGAAEARQRSEGDFILGQVMPFWLIDYRNRQFRNVILEGPFGLKADGTLAYPYGKGDPWQPEIMMANWPELQRPENESVRVALESFLRAVRAAQPFKLPPNAAGGYPRQIRISFILGDL